MEENKDPVKEIEEKKTVIDKGMDFWFHDRKTLKIFKFGIILVTVLIWILMPLLIVKMFWNTIVYKSVPSLIFGVILTYTFFGVLKGLSKVNSILKGFKSEEDIKEETKPDKLLEGDNGQQCEGKGKL